MPYNKRKLQDIKYSEKNLLEQYKTLWQNADFDGINTLFQNNPNLKYKLFDSFNWNRLINLVNDQTSAEAWDNKKVYQIYDMVSYGNYVWVCKRSDDAQPHLPQTGSPYWQQLYLTSNVSSATYDSLVGKWQIDYASLKQASGNFKYAGEWTAGETYYKGNLVKFGDYDSYFYINDTESEATPENQPPNSTYWISAQTMLEPVGIQVSEIPPTNLLSGDMYFQIIN